MTILTCVDKPKKAVIFDLDGTLVDSLEDIGDAANYAMTEMGFRTFSVEEYRVLAGVGTEKLMERLLRIVVGEPYDEALFNEAVQLKLKYENGPNGKRHLKPFPGAHQMLRLLQESGIELAVLSNKAEPTVRATVAKFFPDIAFKYVAGARADTPLKPDPTAALRIVRNYMPRLSPTDCVFIGDTPYDMKTGKAAGMTPVGVPWGNRTADHLRACGAELVVRNFFEISDFVLAGNRELASLMQ